MNTFISTEMIGGNYLFICAHIPLPICACLCVSVCLYVCMPLCVRMVYVCWFAYSYQSLSYLVYLFTGTHHTNNTFNQIYPYSYLGSKAWEKEEVSKERKEKVDTLVNGHPGEKKR